MGQIMEHPLVRPPAVDLWGASDSTSSNSEGWLLPQGQAVTFHACCLRGDAFGPLCRGKPGGPAMFSDPFLITHDITDLEGHKLCKTCVHLIPASKAAEIQLIAQVEKD